MTRVVAWCVVCAAYCIHRISISAAGINTSDLPQVLEDQILSTGEL